MESNECAGRGVCSGGDRWECGQLAGWLDPLGRQPWGGDSDAGLLPYLATMMNEEQEALADIAAVCLDEGAWQGYPSPNGGWEDYGPVDEEEQSWRAAAHDFMERFQSGERFLTEGMIRYAGHDLARELAWLRGWCADVSTSRI